MADISKVNVNSTDYDLKDQKSRDALVDVVDDGAKNLLKNALGSGTKSGLTYTTGTDGSIVITAGTVKGGNADFVIPFTPTKTGQYVLQGCPDGGSGATYKGQIALYPSMANVVEIYENTNATATLTGGTQYAYRFRVYNGKAIGDVTIYPMVCSEAAWDVSHKYVPFARTNSELTTEADYAVNTGVKNLLNLSGITPTVPSGLTLTDNNDGTFSVSGTLASANSITFPIAAISGNLILSGCPSGGGESSYMLRLTKNGTAVSASTDTGNGSQIFSMDSTGYALAARFAAGTYTNVIFKPMIRPAAITDTSYQPYARTNPALTAEMDYAVNTGVKNIAPVNSGSGTSVNLFNRSCFVSAGQYILSYKASDFSGNYELAFYDAADTYIPGGLNGSITANKYVEFRLRADAYRMRFSILGTAKITELMIRPAAITDPTFQPYACTNRELTVLTDEDRAALVEIVDGGAKNVLYYTKVGTSVESGSQYLSNGVRFTLQSDSSILVNRESSNVNEAFCNLRLNSSSQFIDDFCNGQYVLSGSYGDCILRATNNTYNAIDTGNGVVLQDRWAQTSIWVQIRVAASASPNNVTVKPMICTKAAWDISHAFQPYRLPYQEISDTVQALKKVHHYGFIIDKNNSDSYTAVSYTHGAVGFSPAYMDYTNNKFVYGSWGDAWFIRDAVPVALNFDGTEAFELDKSDFTKKADGTASGIDCITMVLTDSQPSDWTTNWKWYYTKSGDYYVAITDASAPTWAENTYYKAVSALDVNFMLRMPKVYFKRSNDDGHNYIEISDRQLDSDFHAYAHIDANGVEKDYIYLPLFKGSMINGKFRSVPNVWPQNFTTAQNEIDAAAALGTGWQIWDHSSRELINDLLILISKSLDSQATFGRGRESGYVDNKNWNYGLLKTGSLMQNGMFYGSSSSTAEVKVFGIESFWANRWDRVLGLILLNNSWKIKMHPPYNLTADGYTTPSGASVPSGNGYFKYVHSSEYGSVPAVGGGESSKYYRDYFYKNASGTRVALVGGNCNTGANDGFRYVRVNFDASGSAWYVGASPVYK